MIDGQPYNFYKYEQIRREQLIIAWMSKGAISVSETDNMPIHDRKLLFATLQQAYEDQKKKREEEAKSRPYRNRGRSHKRR
jgi:hypothetical protein